MRSLLSTTRHKKGRQARDVIIGFLDPAEYVPPAAQVVPGEKDDDEEEEDKGLILN